MAIFGIYFFTSVKIMDNKKTDISKLSDKILKGLKKATRKLVETSAANNEELLIGDGVKMRKANYKKAYHI
jgi:hypothetical protein